MYSVHMLVPVELPQPAELSDFTHLKDAAIFLRVSSWNIIIQNGWGGGLCLTSELITEVPASRMNQHVHFVAVGADSLLSYSWCL